LEHVYQHVECHILEDHNVSFHSSKGCSTDEGKAWFEVTILKTLRKTRQTVSGTFPYVHFLFTGPCPCVIWQVIINMSEYTMVHLVEALRNKQKVGGSIPDGVIRIIQLT
jgi:hypothetical protein